MKKSISTISLLIICATQSCDRSDDAVPSDDQLKTTSYQLKRPSAENTLSKEEPETDNANPNDEKKPHKDKQHWRIPQDSIL